MKLIFKNDFVALTKPCVCPLYDGNIYDDDDKNDDDDDDDDENDDDDKCSDKDEDLSRRRIGLEEKSAPPCTTMARLILSFLSSPSLSFNHQWHPDKGTIDHHHLYDHHNYCRAPQWHDG